MQFKCSSCGANIVADTHARNNGLCTPCSRKMTGEGSPRDKLNPFYGEGFGCVVHYMDASVLIKYFIEEEGSDRIREYVERCLKVRRGHEIVFRTTSLCFGETLGFFKNQRKNRKLSHEEYASVAGKIIDSISSVFEIEEPHLNFPFEPQKQVKELIKKYDLDVSDAFQMVAIKWIKEEHAQLLGGLEAIMVSADWRLVAAARGEGIRAWNVLLEECI